ncbi:hypothetical protein NP233_g9160 [Leucocoprinus birnbaumii]|uniref:Uncharacterized protein n=1 Tax=Leucocoprinus birnbaumii TaxID=56174 RepID=A0AAD5YR49_9AGAR|nr:hypothetical protein NP233_g9160 [Leucocoprinus birnbaumii]
MLDAFKIKPFNLQPIYEEWQDGPYFNGNPKKDLPVDEWLEKIKEGCVKRGVPEEYWYKVAQHFMGTKARARLDELKEVIRKVHGGKYRWTWKKFCIALRNMGWEIDKDEKKTIKVSAKSLGLWFTRKKDGSDANLTEEPESESNGKESSFSPPPSRKQTRRGSVSESVRSERSAHAKSNSQPSTRPPVKRSATMMLIPGTGKDKDATQRPTPVKTRSDTTVLTRKTSPPSSPTRSHTIDLVSPEVHGGSEHGGEVLSATQAPVWLLNACNALDFITSEHPKAMSVISAILITVGSIPAIPAISAGAGGAVLASGAAHAVGAIAVGLGQALSMSVKNSNQNQPNQGSSNAPSHH